MIALTDNNTIVGIRILDQVPRRPAIREAAHMPDFGSDADLVVERQAHAVTRAELARVRALLAGALATLRKATNINLELLNKMAGESDKFVVDVPL